MMVSTYCSRTRPGKTERQMTLKKKGHDVIFVTFQSTQMSILTDSTISGEFATVDMSDLSSWNYFNVF